MVNKHLNENGFKNEMQGKWSTKIDEEAFFKSF